MGDSSGKRRGQDFKMIPGHDSGTGKEHGIDSSGTVKEHGTDSSGTVKEHGIDSSGNKTGQDLRRLRSMH